MIGETAGVPTVEANPRRFSRDMHEFRASVTDSETALLDSLSWYGIAAERGCRILDWSSVRCGCGERFEAEGEASVLGPLEPLPSAPCPRCGGDAQPKAYLPDLVLSRKKRLVIEVSGAKSSIADPSKVGFYMRTAVLWVEVKNETVKDLDAVKSLCQALGAAVGTSHPERVWGLET